MKVIRMEDMNGRGVYQSPEDFGASLWRICTDGACDPNHPLPDGDKGFMDSLHIFRHNPKVRELCKIKNPLCRYAIYDGNGSYKTKFGFKNRDQFLQWCYDPVWRLRLERSGEAHLSIYEVDEDFVIIGDTQVIFVQEMAKLVDQLPFTYFDYGAR